MCVHRNVHNCCTQYCTEQTWQFSPYPPDNHHSSDDVYLREGGGTTNSTRFMLTITHRHTGTGDDVKLPTRRFILDCPCCLTCFFVSVLPVHAPTTSFHSVNSPLTIHNSLSLSLPAQDLPLSQIFPPIDSIPASGLTPRTLRQDRFFWASPFYVFSFFIILFCLVPCGRLSWLLVSFWTHVNIVHHIISYHIRFTAFSLPGQFAPRSKSATRTLANSLPGTFAGKGLR